MAIAKFLVYSDTIEFEALTEGKHPGPDIVRELNTLKLKASDILAAIEKCEHKVELDLQRTSLSDSAKQQNIQNEMDGFQRLRAWGGLAIEAADALLTLLDRRARGLPIDTAKQTLANKSSAFVKSKHLIQAAFDIEKKRREELINSVRKTA
jgi:hypothetical protein